MITDRELLEGAAKAAGYVLDEHSRNGSVWAWVYAKDSEPDVDGEMPIFRWSPFNDDGDALRLAVKLELEISASYDAGENVYVGYAAVGDDMKYVIESKGSDPYAATRRAIVRAAYEIGRAKP